MNISKSNATKILVVLGVFFAMPAYSGCSSSPTPESTINPNPEYRQRDHAEDNQNDEEKEDQDTRSTSN